MARLRAMRNYFLLIAIACVFSHANALTCLNSEIVHRFQVALPGENFVDVTPVQEKQTVEKFYQYAYGPLVYATASKLNVNNGTVVLIHHDLTTNSYSLVLINGPPLDPVSLITSNSLPHTISFFLKIYLVSTREHRKATPLLNGIKSQWSSTSSRPILMLP